MTLIIQGQPVERIVIHGSEQTVWEFSGSGGNGEVVLQIAKVLEQLGIAEIISFDFNTIHNIEPERVDMTENVSFGFDHVHKIEPYGSMAGISDTVQIFINDEEIV